MKWIIVFYQILVSAPDGEIYFSGLATGQKMTREIESIPRSCKTKVECQRDLKPFKGNKNLEDVNSFNGEKYL